MKPLVDLSGEVRTTDAGGRGKASPGYQDPIVRHLGQGKPLELHWLSGRMHRLGLEYGVPTPGHSVAYRGLVLYEHGKPAECSDGPARLARGA